MMRWRFWAISLSLATLGTGAAFAGSGDEPHAPATSADAARIALQRAITAMGAARLTSVRYSGAGRIGTAGESPNPNAAWALQPLTAYTRTIDYPSESSKEQLAIVDAEPVVNFVCGRKAWSVAAGRTEPEFRRADEWRLELWLTPYGFLKRALAADPEGRNSNGGWAISFVAPGGHPVTGTIDGRGFVTSVVTTIPNPVLGEMSIEDDYSDYKNVNGAIFPGRIVEKQGGFTTLDLTVTGVKINLPNAAMRVPPAIFDAQPPPETVSALRLGEGAWLLGGGTRNSVLVEFADYLAVIEAPLDDERSLAVMAAAKKLAPGKPIRYAVNTHPHFDHAGGLRGYAAEGAAIVTHSANIPFYEKAWKTRPLPNRPVFVGVKGQYTLADSMRTLRIYEVENDTHAGTMLVAYLPKEKILIEADDFTPASPTADPPAPWTRSLALNLRDNVERLQLDVEKIAPVDGNLAPWQALLDMAGVPDSARPHAVKTLDLNGQ